MARTSMPRAARKPVRVSNRSSAAPSESLASAASARNSPAASSGIAAHGEEAFDQRAGLARQPRPGAERGLFEKALGDLGDRAAADRFDAGDREKIGDEVMRGLGIGTGQRGEHALVFRRAVGGGERELVEIVRQRPFPVEILDQAALPGRRQIERGDEGGKQPDVADADVRRRQAIKRGRFEPERQHFGVGRRLVLPGEEFDAGLQELRGQSLAVAKDGAEIAERRPPCRPPAIADRRARPEW